MKKIIIFLFYFLVGLSLSAQDIVYDSISGNKTSVFRIRGGVQEKSLKVFYENSYVLTQSKIMTSIGLTDGLKLNVDYRDYVFKYDTLTYEFTTDCKLNVIIYKYQTGTLPTDYFVGVRKSILGATMFEGQYLFISPIVAVGSQINIYDGIGATRKLLTTIKQTELSASSIKDFELTSNVTIQCIKIGKNLRLNLFHGVPTKVDVTTMTAIKAYPNPTNDKFYIEIGNNEGCNIRVFNVTSVLKYQEKSFLDRTTLDVSGYSKGMYIVVITDANKGNILKTIKLVKI
jgi:hypothetical protein